MVIFHKHTKGSKLLAYATHNASVYGCMLDRGVNIVHLLRAELALYIVAGPAARLSHFLPLRARTAMARLLYF